MVVFFVDLMRFHWISLLVSSILLIFSSLVITLAIPTQWHFCIRISGQLNLGAGENDDCFAAFMDTVYAIYVCLIVAIFP